MDSLSFQPSSVKWCIIGFGIWLFSGGIAFPQLQSPSDTQSEDREPTLSVEGQDPIIERGVIRDHRGQQKLLPLPRRPVPAAPVPPTPSQAPTQQVSPKVPSPSTIGPTTGTHAPPDRYTAPTASLTLIANSIRLRHKSLTTLVTIPPNLPVPQPVEISIGYYSPAGNQRITQSYVRSTGNRFLYNDREGDGKSRRLRMDITLSEPKPGGGVTSFALPWKVDLDPLYDVRIGPFAFDLISKCDAVGKSEIIFTWYTPDRKYNKQKFSMRAGTRTTIGGFAWSGSEVSWSHKLFREQAHFYDDDNLVTELLWECFPGCTFNPIGLNQDHLLTGKSMLVKGNLKARNDDCQAYYEYQMTKTLRWYPEP
jgi:hypothetical protein